MYLDRLLLLYQRLRRDKTFSKPALADADDPKEKSYCQVPCLLHVCSNTCCPTTSIAEACH